MKKRLLALAAAALLPLAAWSATNPPAGDLGGQPSLTSGEVLQSVQMDGALLTDALSSLGRQAGINFQFDPHVTSGGVSADGRTNTVPSVSFRFENVTAAQAFVAVLENHGLQFVADPRTKIGRVTLKDSATTEPLVTRVISLKHAHATNLVSLLQPTLSPRSKVLPDPRTGHLVIFATEREMTTVDEFIAKLDSSLPQFLIEARFLETTRNPKTSKGMDWSGTFAKQNLKFGNTVSAPGAVSLGNPQAYLSTVGSPAPGLLNADGLNAVLSLLNTGNETELLATPSAVTIDGVQTELSVVRNIPIFDETLAAGTAGNNTVAVTANYNLTVGQNVLNEIGIKLFVTPRLQGESNVFLDLRPEISDQELTPARSSDDDKAKISPIFTRRKLNTQAVVPNGYTLVLGGLASDSKADVTTKVPFLGDIPGIGLAFRSSTKERTKRNLMIFVTPTRVEYGDFQNRPRPDKFFQTKPALSEEKPEDALSSTKPYDWTKPIDQ